MFLRPVQKIEIFMKQKFVRSLYRARRVEDADG
jgi:hypothetical protein